MKWTYLHCAPRLRVLPQNPQMGACGFTRPQNAMTQYAQYDSMTPQQTRDARQTTYGEAAVYAVLTLPGGAPFFCAAGPPKVIFSSASLSLAAGAGGASSSFFSSALGSSGPAGPVADAA